ncbi:hypothetical protein ABPG72_012370 [Tetrahymena utriculariae]
MSQDPKIVNPQLWPNPNKLRFADLYKYQGVEMRKINDSIKNYKAAKFYLAGILGGCLVFKFFIDAAVDKYIFGENGNGGKFLEMQTINSNYDYYYNRQFQRMRYLTEDPAGDDPLQKTKDEHLVDLGFIPKVFGANAEVRKRAPHDKYL